MKEYIVRYETEQIENSEFFYGGKVECELIRCKDCKYYTGKWCTKFSTKQFDINDICKADDDYCSMAKRKEE